MEKKTQKRVTLRQIAKECNLSVSTVSDILNKNQSCSSEKTRNLVLTTAKALGYRPNIGYKLMRGISTKTVAITLFSKYMVDSEYLQKIITLLVQKLTDKGYFPLIITLPDDWDERRQALDKVLERGAEFLISLWSPCREADLLELSTHIPIVMMGSSPFPNKVASVELDVIYGVTKILEHFKASGCKHIKMISKKNDYHRIKAFTDFMGENIEKHILELTDEDTGIFHESNPERCIEIGYQKTKELLETLAPETDAIFYFTDLYALGGAKYLQEIGRKDILIGGYNNTIAARASLYPISSVGHNEEEIVDLMLEFESKKPERVMINPKVFIRN